MASNGVSNIKMYKVRKIEGCCLMIFNDLNLVLLADVSDKPRYNAAHHLAEHLVVQPKCSLARVAPARNIEKNMGSCVTWFSKTAQRQFLSPF